MNHMTIEFEDAMHLQGQLAYLYERLVKDAPLTPTGNVALYDLSELKAELERRNAAMAPIETAAEPEKPVDKPVDKPATKTPARKKAAAPAEPPAEEPEPDAKALPTTVDKPNREAGGIASDLPSQDEMEQLLQRFFAVASLDTMRQVVFETTGSKTLKGASKDTWPALKARLQTELAAGAK